MGTLYRRTRRGNWYADFTDANGSRVQRSTRTANKQIAGEVLRSWERQSHATRHLIRNKSVTLQTLLDDYIDYLGDSGEKHQNYVRSALTRLFDYHQWTRPEQITQYEVETFAVQLKDQRSGKAASARTKGFYIGEAKAFTKWLRVIRKAIHEDPLEAIRKPSTDDADRRRVRRYLLHDEWRWLSKTPHALLYETAIQTGFRSSEIQQLQPADLRSDHLFLAGRWTKNDDDAKQYITTSLRDRLNGHLPFEVPDHQRLAKLLAADLKTAREMASDVGPLPRDFLTYMNSSDQVLDFHALRHTCGAWLAIAGVQPKVIQSVMRHSSITLTLDTYGHLFPGAEKDAIQNFAEWMG